MKFLKFIVVLAAASTCGLAAAESDLQAAVSSPAPAVEVVPSAPSQEALPAAVAVAEPAPETVFSLVDDAEPAQEATPGSFAYIATEAEQGSANAQWVLGYMYMIGDQVEANPQTAAVWFEKAASQGMVRAQQTMGMLYYWGHGVSQDYQTAASWYSKAARSGDAQAQLTIGKMYISGIGVTQNSNTALNWLELASAKRLEAHYLIAVIYHDGIGIEQNYRKSAIHYQAAADAGHELAQSAVGRFYLLGMGVPQDNTIAADYLEKAASAGLPDAQFLLGRLYMTGDGRKQDYAKALNLFAQAADSRQLDPEMRRMSNLLAGNIYLQKKELIAAYKQFDLAAQEGSRDEIARVKLVRNAVAAKAKIKIETRLVPMEGSGQIALYEGRLVEYDPILSDFSDPYVAPSASLPNIDWWNELQPSLAYSYGETISLDTTQVNIPVLNSDRVALAGG